MRARILGSGGFIPTGERETNCLLVLGPEGAIVVDAGTGLRRLVLDPSLLGGRTDVDLVLTHPHIDHVMGLGFLAARHPMRVRLWGPGAALYGRPTRDLLAAHLNPPVLPELDRLFTTVGDLPLGTTMLAGIPVTARGQHAHPVPTLGLRFADDLVWCTDTAHDEGTAAFAAGARVLCHDAWGHGLEPDGLGSHTTGAQAGGLAAAAGVERLVLIHVPPQGDPDALLAEARRAFPATELGRDGLTLP